VKFPRIVGYDSVPTIYSIGTKKAEFLQAMSLFGQGSVARAISKEIQTLPIDLRRYQLGSIT